jgi:hypothetical protein
VLPFFQVKFVEIVFENEISGADLASWSVGTADCCRTGSALGSALVKDCQKEDEIEYNLEHLASLCCGCVSDVAFIDLSQETKTK